MQVSSSNIALTLLKGTPTSTVASLPLEQAPAKFEPTVVGEEDPELTAAMTAYAEGHVPEHIQRAIQVADRVMGMMSRIDEGQLSPLDPEVVNEFNGGSLRNTSDPRMEFAGVFPGAEIASRMGQKAPSTGDTNFLDRRDAMVTAYHFGMDFAEMMRSVAQGIGSAARDAQGTIYGLSSSGEFRPDEQADKLMMENGNDQLVLDMQNMETLGSGLAKNFSFDKVAATGAAYDGKLSAISITHGTYGKIMDISKDGAVTLYDAQGNGFSAEEYNAANLNERIPELHNDLVELGDRQLQRAAAIEAFSRAGKSLPDWKPIALL